MALGNTATRYGSLSKLMHWTMALGILAMIPLGKIANDMGFDTPDLLAQKAQLFSIHKTIGVVLFILAVIRLVWMVTQPKPVTLHPDRKLETFAAETVHVLLYASLALVPLTGWIEHAAATGFAPILWPFGQDLPLIPDSPALAEFMAGAHKVAVRLLILSLLLHIAGALKHHVIDRDATLRRMLPGSTEAGTATQEAHSRLPLIAAVVAYVAAFGVGAQAGLFSHAAEAPEAAQLEEVQTEWVVETGAINIGVRQFGSDIAGSFADWTAAISFDDTITEGPLGTVTTQISIGSLTLGSVTSQALGTEYFDAETHPVATFEAKIVRAEDGYEAQGTLTLKGASVPTTLPFTLELDGDRAEMAGSLTLNRIDFGIGGEATAAGQPEPMVTVDITLTATR